VGSELAGVLGTLGAFGTQLAQERSDRGSRGDGRRGGRVLSEPDQRGQFMRGELA
jgi:hypothetical protein